MTSLFVGKVIVLKSSEHGTYVSGRGGMDSEAQIHDSFGATEEFLVEAYAEGKCTLKNVHGGCFLHATHDEKAIFVETVGNEEKSVWTIKEVDGKFELKSRWGTSLKVTSDGKVLLHRVNVTKDTLFEIRDTHNPHNLFDGKVVSIKVLDGKYVSGRGGKDSEVQVEKDNGEKEKFLVEAYAEGKWTLKNVSEQLFLHATSENTALLVQEYGDEEKSVWKILRTDDGKYNLQSRWGSCLVYDAEGEGKMYLKRTQHAGEEVNLEIIEQL